MVADKKYHVLGKIFCQCWVWGLYTKGGGKGAFQVEEFQMLEDLLVVNDKYGPVVKEVRIKSNIINFSNICVEHVEQCKLIKFQLL